jgi:hypothetical protein
MHEEIKESSSTTKMKSRESVFEKNGILFPLAKKGEFTDNTGFYVMKERDGKEEF